MPRKNAPIARGPWWEIRAAAQPRTAELLIYGDIGDSWWDDTSTSALDVARTLADLDVDTLTVRINSYGGSVSDGLAIYNADRKSTRLNSSHIQKSRMPSSA